MQDPAFLPVREERVMPLRGFGALALLTTVLASVWVVTDAAQSPNAFGTPSADNPQPSAHVGAVRG